MEKIIILLNQNIIGYTIVVEYLTIKIVINEKFFITIKGGKIEYTIVGEKKITNIVDFINLYLSKF